MYYENKPFQNNFTFVKKCLFSVLICSVDFQLLVTFGYCVHFLNEYGTKITQEMFLSTP